MSVSPKTPDAGGVAELRRLYERADRFAREIAGFRIRTTVRTRPPYRNAETDTAEPNMSAAICAWSNSTCG